MSYVECVLCVVFFFFKQKTAYEMRISDWSSDVCSSDLEDFVRDIGLLGLDAQQRTVRRIERRFPQLLGIHLAQPLVAADREALAAVREDRLEQFGGARDRIGLCVRRGGNLALFAIGRPGFDLGGRAACLHQSSRARIAVGLFGGELVHTARFLDGEEARIDRMMIADPAPAAFERIAAAFDRSEEHTSELQSLMRISYAVFCLKHKNTRQ